MNARQRSLRSPGGELAMIGHFPPPISGMAVAVERLFTSLRAGGVPVERLSIAGDSLQRSIRNHAQRVCRVFGALLHLVPRHRRLGCVYVSCDAGPGVVYTIILTATARLLGLRRVVHHHSYAYLREPAPLFRLLVRVAGVDAWHVVGCRDMAVRLRELYTRVQRVFILPIAYAIDAPPEGAAYSARRPLVLGHLGNLTAAKGLRTVFETLHRCRAAGLRVHLVLAGPPGSRQDADFLRAARAAAREAVTYLGPVDDAGKERFFAAIDVFLFPTRYRHESFGLVAGEALAAGVPVLTYEAGCLDEDVVGDGGFVFPPDAPFVDRAVTHLTTWAADPALLERARAAARARFAELKHDAEAALADFCRLAGATRVSPTEPLPIDDGCDGLT